ncbi:hypothetical protein GLOIN_2v1768213 [Rhizophagus clarus]|uniref:Uncharacterized protein n=1 Tax=Rhizophagus clarus TaxID=94130 RepID=A0A8H3LGU6_9GLOM|nr:hypothetical protein GLOIN_2v1768213 [Rhizophagus clarus]
MGVLATEAEEEEVNEEEEEENELEKKSLFTRHLLIFSYRRDGTCAMVAFLYQHLNQGLPILPIVIKSFGTALLYHNTMKFFRNRNIPDRAITGFGRNAAPPCNGPMV